MLVDAASAHCREPAVTGESFVRDGALQDDDIRCIKLSVPGILKMLDERFASVDRQHGTRKESVRRAMSIWRTSLKLTLLAALGLSGAVGCESGAGTGALIGGAVGAGTGAIIGNNSKGRTGEGALIGGAVGAAAGGLIGHAADENDRRRGREYDRYDRYDRRDDRYDERYDDRYDGPRPGGRDNGYYEYRSYRSRDGYGRDRYYEEECYEQ